jgi:lipopolysaccharide/colanic/teichoic acid biosynthesis glycosyltransferase
MVDDGPLDRGTACGLIALALGGARLVSRARYSDDLAHLEGGRQIEPSVQVRIESAIRQPLAYRRAKRVMDLLLASALLLLLCPLMLLIIFAIRLESRGPAIFVQERLGRDRQPFRCLKFRSMQQHAERLTGPIWASLNDPRITRVGRFLRATKLDELPQLINVLKGEMSLVGNRPIRAHFADLLAQTIPFYDLRFAVAAGLTGWAQLEVDYARSVEGQLAKFRSEIVYISRCSILLDLMILLRTIALVFGFGHNKE